MYELVIDNKSIEIFSDECFEITLYFKKYTFDEEKIVEKIKIFLEERNPEKRVILNKLFDFMVSNLEVNKINISYMQNGIKYRRKEMFNEIYLGIGTNKGDRLGNIQKLIKKLKKSGIIYLDAVSSLYESKPVGYKEQQNFYNMVIKGRTRLNSRSLLEYVKKIEYEMGRRWSKKNHPRIIDVDILFYGDQVIDENSLKIPHNKIYERDFVLIPLVELESDFHDPTNYRLLKDFIKNPDSLKKVRDKKELL